MSTFDTPKPSFDDTDLIGLLHREYGLVCRVRTLPGERDQNLLATTEDGSRYVLKVAHVNESLAELNLQNAILLHIAGRDPALPIPRVLATRSGLHVTHVVHSTGHRHHVRVLSFLPGVLLHSVDHTEELIASFGAFVGKLSKTLLDFMHVGALRQKFLWNLDNALNCAEDSVYIADRSQAAMVDTCFERYRRVTLPKLLGLRCAVLHQDANDYNVVVGDDGERIAGLIDFGDVVWGRQINEVAVALAYVLLNSSDTLASAAQFITAYHAEFPLLEMELEVLFDLVCMRLCMSVCISSRRSREFADNDYLLVSQGPALALLSRLANINPEFATLWFRSACGLRPVRNGAAIVDWLHEKRGSFSSLLGSALGPMRKLPLRMDKDAPGVELATDAEAHSEFMFSLLGKKEADIAVGGYLEDREVYLGDDFAPSDGGERRTVHLGIDIVAPMGTPIHAPLAGKVVSAVDNAAHLDYGPTLILEHTTDATGLRFFTLYGHLSRESLRGLSPGDTVAGGQRIGAFGAPKENGGWVPHVHFQVMTDLLGLTGNFPGVAQNSRIGVWRQICPDPNLILDLPPESMAETGPSDGEVLEARSRLLGPSLSTSYSKPLKMLRGRGVWLTDQRGRDYLDCVNNISHVGHSHPVVVRAICEQAKKLNTNTRYLHDNIIELAKRIGESLPSPLSVCFFVCSGSEANELALRLARTHTARRHGIVLDHAYHGNTSTLIGLSPYKCEGRGGAGLDPLARKVPLPYPYRDQLTKLRRDFRSADYGREVELVVESLTTAGTPPAFFIAESISGCGGQVVLPAGYLSSAFAAVRKVGGLCILDEVQVGFGRVGSHFWAFETQEVVPDIVTMGKPMGNGHPLACVVTTPEIAASFANGMEYFNSFGGNPVSCAAGLAVMDVIRTEGLQRNAEVVGAHLLHGFEHLKTLHPLIGDVRGLGLFSGIELVGDRATGEPAGETASHVVEAMKDRGVLLSTDGPFGNVIKVKPPMGFSKHNSDRVLNELDDVLRKLRK